MKGVSVLIAFVLVMVISVAALTIALNIGNPTIEKSKEILILSEGKENIKIIDSAINQVLQEGDGSSRKISISVTGGTYNIEKNRLEFEMQTMHNIVASGVSIEEDGIKIESMNGKIVAYIEYNFNFVNVLKLYSGMNTILISNNAGSIEIN